jgi:hypothetical protein
VTPAATSSAISVAEYQKMSKEDDTAAIAGQLADLHAGRLEHDKAEHDPAARGHTARPH